MRTTAWLEWSLHAVLVLLLVAGTMAGTRERNAHSNVSDAPPEKCLYLVKLPADLDLPNTPHFDTTIVRSVGCKHHVLHFPGWGTGTTYKLDGNGVEREVGFTNGDKKEQWMDITDLPTGSYSVKLWACGNGGNFTLRIK